MGTTENDSTQLTPRDIGWKLAPIARAETVDLLGLTPAETLSYAAGLQDETRIVRELLHEAVAMVARQRDELARATRIIDCQRQQLRELYPRAAA